MLTIKPGMMFPVQALRAALPDVETTLFFGKLFDLTATELSKVLVTLHNTTLMTTLLGEGSEHSNELQDYLVDIGYGQVIENGDIAFVEDAPKGEILPEVWKSLQVEVAQSIKDVACKLGDVMGLMPGKQGEMVFKSMMVLNARRPMLGDYKALIHHGKHPDNLVIFDCSGSMGQETCEMVANEVVSLGFMADAHLVIVSDNTYHWNPGEYSVETVMAKAEYAGTHYEKLAPILDQDWGVVVTIADYDSSRSAKDHIAECSGRIDTVLDISLVNRPTYLSEVVGQLANEVRPLLVAADNYCCMGY
jgi:hypothetical protein